MNITIKQACIIDLDDLISLFDQYRIFYKQSSDIIAARNFLLDRITNKQSTIFIAYIARTAVGFVQLYPLFSSVSMHSLLLLNDLYVSPQYRSNGVGESLLEHCQSYAVLSSATGLVLETAKDNPAQQLYKKLGWKENKNFLHYTWNNIPKVT